MKEKEDHKLSISLNYGPSSVFVITIFCLVELYFYQTCRQSKLKIRDWQENFSMDVILLVLYCHDWADNYREYISTFNDWSLSI